MEFSLKNLKLFRIITETKKIIVEIELLDVKWNEFEETFVMIKFLERSYKLLKIIIDIQSVPMFYHFRSERKYNKIRIKKKNYLVSKSIILFDYYTVKAMANIIIQ